jgi:hypothetical protein
MAHPPVHKRTGHLDKQQLRTSPLATSASKPPALVPSSRAAQAHLDLLSYTPATDNLRELYTVQEGLSRSEHASLLHKRSQFARDNFERGATITGSVLFIPTDVVDGRPRDKEKVNIGSQPHAVNFVREFIDDERTAIEKGTRLFKIGNKACGQWIDGNGRLTIFKTIYDQIRKDEHGNYRSREEKAKALDPVLEETARWAGALPEPTLEPTPEEIHERMLWLADELSLDEPYEGITRASFESGATYDENEIYAEIYEAAIGDTDALLPEQDDLVGEMRDRVGISLDANYERINLDELVPALPEGYVIDGEFTEAGNRLFQETLPRVDRAIESGASRKEILDAIYKEHAEAARTDHAERVAAAFAQDGSGAGEPGEPTRQEKLLALTTFRVLLSGEYLRETRGYSRESIRWAKEFDEQNPSRHHLLFNPVGERRPGAQVDLKRGEREKLRELDRAILERRAVTQQAEGRAKAPPRHVVDRLNELEQAGQRVAAMIDRLNPTVEERVSALNVVNSRSLGAQLSGELKIEEYENLHALAQSLASQNIDSLKAEREVDEQHARDATRLSDGIEKTRNQLLVANGTKVDSPQEARDLASPYLRGLTTLTNVIETNIKRLDGSSNVRLSDERTPVFISLTANSHQRLPVGNLREYTELSKAARELRVNITTWPGLFHTEEIGAPNEDRTEEVLFIGSYIDYRLQDHETRMLNERPAYRAYADRLDSAQTPEDLRATAREIRKENYASDQQFKAHLSDPQNVPAPSEYPLRLHEMRALFLSSSPAHYTPEMRDIKFSMSIMGREKAERTAALHRGSLTPSHELSQLLKELDTRQSERSLNHYYRSLRQPMDRPASLDLRKLHEGLQQYERDYLNESFKALRCD